jgi:hypothetical protein
MDPDPQNALPVARPPYPRGPACPCRWAWACWPTGAGTSRTRGTASGSPCSLQHKISYRIYGPMIYVYGPVRNAFDAGSIHYEGKWEGVGPCVLYSVVYVGGGWDFSAVNFSYRTALQWPLQ